MYLAIALGVGVLFAFAVMMFILGIRGTDEMPKLPAAEARERATGLLLEQVGLSLVAGIATWVFTGWIGAAVGMFAGGAMFPLARAQAAASQHYVDQTEALAAWVEQLRDSLVSGGGLEGPLRYSAKTGPEYLRPELRELAADLQTKNTVEALERFAANVKHPTADLLVSAYAVAVRESVEGLEQLLTGIARDADLEVKTLRKVDTSRKQLKSSSRIISVILASFIIGPLVVARDFLVAFDTLGGQAVLVVISAMFLTGYWWLGKLSTIRRQPRFFALDEGTDATEGVSA